VAGTLEVTTAMLLARVGAATSSAGSARAARGPWLNRPAASASAAAAAAVAVVRRARRAGRVARGPASGFVVACSSSGRGRLGAGGSVGAAVARRCGATAVAEAAVEEGEAAAESKRPPLQLKRDAQGKISSLMVTTPLFYANGSPHIGSAYPTICSDVMARFAKLRGAEVHFVTGMDEHGEKIAKTAEGRKTSPQELVDEIAGEFQGLWEKLDIRHDHFARTTSEVHKKLVYEMWQRCQDKGDIYKKAYSGHYCIGCEAYLDKDEMDENNVCKIHRKVAEFRTEENYFFRLSKYWEQVKAHVEANNDFILPKGRRNEILYFLQDDNKRDFSISRVSTNWGIPVPGDDSQVIYVWFDALLGYMSSLLQPGDPPTLEMALKRGWPADVHVIGKDILRFHALYWPAMLMAAGLPLPKHVMSHGFLTKDGLKMGKSLGNVVEPIPLVEKFGPDAVRFFFSSCLFFGEDGDFSTEAFAKKVNASLANTLGNLVHRLLTLLRKSLVEPLAPNDAFSKEALNASVVYKSAVEAPERVDLAFRKFNFEMAADKALFICDQANQRIMEVEPWAKIKPDAPEEEKQNAIREMLVMAEGVRICAHLLSPIIPGVSKKILDELHGPGNAPEFSWKETAWKGERALLGLTMDNAKPVPVFMRIEMEEDETSKGDEKPKGNAKGTWKPSKWKKPKSQ